MIAKEEVLFLIGQVLTKTYKVVDRKTSQIVHHYQSDFPRPDIYYGPAYLHLEMTAAEKVTWLQQNGGFMDLTEEQRKLKEIKEQLQAGSDVREAMIQTLDTLDGPEEGTEPVVEAPVEVQPEPVIEQPVTEEPSPVVEEPVIEAPVEQPAVEEPAVEPQPEVQPEPVIEQPVVEPVVEQPVEEVVPEAPVEAPVEVQPEPVIEQPVIEEPEVEQPVVEEPVLKDLDKQILFKGIEEECQFVDSHSWVCKLIDGKLVCEAV